MTSDSRETYIPQSIKDNYTKIYRIAHLGVQASLALKDAKKAIADWRWTQAEDALREYKQSILEKHELELEENIRLLREYDFTIRNLISHIKVEEREVELSKEKTRT